MLPELPSTSINQFPILQQWFGLISLVLVLFGVFVTVRKMWKADTGGSIMESPVANMPKYYFEGPLMQVMNLLNSIQSSVLRIERKLDDIKSDRRARSDR